MREQAEPGRLRSHDSELAASSSSICDESLSARGRHEDEINDRQALIVGTTHPIRLSRLSS